MNLESIRPNYDSASFASSDVPFVPTSFDSAIEASAADLKRQLQLDIEATAGPELQQSPVISQPCVGPVDAHAQAVTNSPTADNELGTTAMSDADRAVKITPSSSETENPGKHATAENDLITDRESNAVSDSPAVALRPYWVPPGLDLSDWSPQLLSDVAALINPLYLELVQSVQEPLARSIGCTIVYLHWLEIIDQMEIGSSALGNDFVRVQHALEGDPRPALIERYLRVVGAKLRFSQFLVRLQEIKLRHERPPAPAVRKSRDPRPGWGSSFVDAWPTASGTIRSHTIQELIDESERRKSSS